MVARRNLLVTGAAAASGSVLGANDRVAVALVGCGGRGKYVTGFMREAPGVVLAAACDVHEPTAAAARDWAGGSATVYTDFRRVLERKDIDAVVVATPDHWHAGVAVLACKAGKHVYIEKPLSHNVREGRAIADAAKASGRIVQAGTQHRSSPHIAEAARVLQSGALGGVHFVRVWNYINMYPNGIGKAADGEPPAGLDWDFYCGPAPLVPYNVKRFQRTYRWFWDYSGGFITDFGTHRFDSVHQIMGVDAPRTVSASGGRFRMQDAGEIPDVLQVTYEYPGFVMSYEACTLNGHGVGGRTAGMRYYNARGADDRPNGMAFYGTNGAMYVDRVGYEIYPEPKPGAAAEFRTERVTKQGADTTSLHAKKFIEAIRNGGPPPVDAEAGHRATTIAHLGNIAFKTGLKLKWNRERENFDNQPEASALLSRKARAKWNFA